MVKLEVIDVIDIYPNSWNPNHMNEEEYESLVNSIDRTQGRFLEENPIIVRNIDDGYEIIDGEHRWRASKDLGYDQIWCDVKEFEDKEAMELTVILNKDRGHINNFKFSKLLNEFYIPYKTTLEELGGRFGYSYVMIGEIMRVYPRLKSCAMAQISQFSNRSLNRLARVLNDELRYLLVAYSIEKETKGNALEKLVSKTNSITKYAIDEILNNEILRKELEKEGEINRKELEALNNVCAILVESIGTNIFKFSVKMLKNEIDAIINELGVTDLVLFTELGYPPKPWDLWKYKKDEQYGVPDFPGSIPAGIIFNTLYFYTNQGDLIVDPMAGSGTVGEVCSVTKREYKLFDIEPYNDNIEKYDLTDEFPIENADLVFLDPPYYKKNEKEYGEKSISALNREEYLSFFDLLAENIYNSNAQKIAFLMSDYTDDEDPARHIFIWEYVNRFEAKGWITLRHIMAPLPESALHPDFVEKFRESKKLGRLGRSLVIFGRT